MTHNLTVRGWLALLTSVGLWGSGFVAIRMALPAYSPTHLALLRFLAASATIVIYALIAGVRPPARKDIPYILLMGFISISVYHLALNSGERTVTSGAASMLVKWLGRKFPPRVELPETTVEQTSRATSG